MSDPDLVASVAEAPDGTILTVRVMARARRSRMAGTRQEAVLVRLAAVPVDDAANRALIALLAEVLAVPRSRLRVVAGRRVRLKRLRVEGLSADQVRQRLAPIS